MQNTVNEQDGSEIIFIGTMHVSKESASEVESVLLQEKPDTVCVELDESRVSMLQQPAEQRWNPSRTEFFLFKLLAAFQNKIGNKMDSNPGSEFLIAIQKAQELQAKIIYIDRDIRITFQRMWKTLGFLGRIRFAFYILIEMVFSGSIKKEEIQGLLKPSEIEKAIEEMSDKFPVLKRVLLDERDEYMALRIKQNKGKKTVVVLGAAHVEGVIRNLKLLP